VRRLNLLRQLYPERTNGAETGTVARDKTADERADQMINEMIKEKFPAVLGLEKELARAEKDFIEKTINNKETNEQTVTKKKQ